jgi:hypothetical protein
MAREGTDEKNYPSIDSLTDRLDCDIPIGIGRNMYGSQFKLKTARRETDGQWISCI